MCGEKNANLGPIRNVSPRLFGLIGADAGGDSVLGRIVENGLYPADAEALGMIVSNVCYCNAERFFQS